METTNIYVNQAILDLFFGQFGKGICSLPLQYTPKMKHVSHAKTAEIVGLSGAEFLAALAHFEVSPIQYETDEVIQEVNGG